MRRTGYIVVQNCDKLHEELNARRNQIHKRTGS